MIRFLACSFLLILCISCKTYQPNLEFKNQSKTVHNLYFSDTTAEFVYQTNIQAFNNTITGLLVVKPIHNNQHRVLLTTEFGNTLLDLTITENSYIKNYAIPNLDRKIILNMLSHDFKLMLKQNWQTTKVANQNNQIVYLHKNKQKGYYLTYNNNQLQSIQYVKNKPKALINFTNINLDKADAIKIEHFNYNIKIELTKIKF